MSGKAVRRAHIGLAARVATYKASSKTPDQGYNPVIEFQEVMNERPLPRFVMLSDDLSVLATRIVEAYTEEEK